MTGINVYQDTEDRLRQLADKYDVPVAMIVDAILDTLDETCESWEENLDI